MTKEKNVAAAEPQELKRGIKGWQTAFIGLGGVIGSCYFLGVGWCIQVMGPSVFFAFAVVGVIVFGLMISYAELLVNLPRKGTFVEWDGHSGLTGYATVRRRLLRFHMRCRQLQGIQALLHTWHLQ